MSFKSSGKLGEGLGSYSSAAKGRLPPTEIGCFSLLDVREYLHSLVYSGGRGCGRGTYPTDRSAANTVQHLRTTPGTTVARRKPECGYPVPDRSSGRPGVSCRSRTISPPSLFRSPHSRCPASPPIPHGRSALRCVTSPSPARFRW